MKNPEERSGYLSFTEMVPVLSSFQSHFSMCLLLRYILMDLMHPPTSSNYIIRPGKETEIATCLSELGIYGIFVG
jgi:hypothetical protein